MTPSRVTQILIAAWAIAFFGAFVAFYVTPADDFGLAAGWNKVGVFMGWQTVAGALAVLAAISTRRVARGARLRWLGLVPLGFLLLLIAAFAALVIWANMQRPDPNAGGPPGPVSAPAATAIPLQDQ